MNAKNSYGFLKGKRICLAAIGWGLGIVPTAHGGAWDDIGYTALKAEFGASLPSGAGVTYAHVESPVGGNYLAQGTGTMVAYAGVGGFAGKTFIPHSAVSGTSSHADRVGRFLYGTNTNPALGDASLTPLAATVHAYSATQWIYTAAVKPKNASNVLAEPLADGAAIQNHSWVGMGVLSSYNDLLRRVDYMAARDNVLCVSAMNNGVSTVIPTLLASAYNTISVGLASGNRSAGQVAATGIDGGGRQKPDIVAPADACSYAAPVVSSAGAMLWEKAHSTPGLAAATRPEMLKALLLTGATKDKLPSWTITSSKPLDPVFGAGILNIGNSYRTLLAGLDPGPTGWKTSTGASPANGATEIRFGIPAGQTGLEFSASLCWLRTLHNSTPTGAFTPVPDALANLRLTLLDATRSQIIAFSDSAVDNVEHLFLKDLPAGTYTLRIEGDTLAQPARWGLAWRTTLSAPAPILASGAVPAAPQLGLEVDVPGSRCFVDCDKLAIGGRYALEMSADLKTWNRASEFVADTTHRVLTVTTAAGDTRCFFRVVGLSF